MPVASQQSQSGVFACLDQFWKGVIDQVALVAISVILLAHQLSNNLVSPPVGPSHTDNFAVLVNLLIIILIASPLPHPR